MTCGNFGGDFLVRPDKAVYAGGETMTIAALGGGSEPVFVDLIKDGQTVLTTMVDVQAGRGQTEVDLPPDLFGTIELCAYRFGVAGLAVRKSRLIYVEQAGELAVQATFDAPNTGPARRPSCGSSWPARTARPRPARSAWRRSTRPCSRCSTSGRAWRRRSSCWTRNCSSPSTRSIPAGRPQLFSELPFADRVPFQQAMFSRTCRTAAGHQVGQAGGSPFTLLANTYGDKLQRVYQERRAGLQAVLRAWYSLAGSLGLLGIVALALFYPRAFVKTSIVAAALTTGLGSCCAAASCC